MFQGMFGPVREGKTPQAASQVPPRAVRHQFSQASLQQPSAPLPTSPEAGATSGGR